MAVHSMQLIPTITQIGNLSFNMAKMPEEYKLALLLSENFWPPT